jgi:phosphohistidine phosphatase
VREVHPPAAGQILKKISPATLRLTLVRHAKSSRDDVTLKDFMRPLNSRGLRDAPVMGRRLHKNGFQPDLIVSSPAARAIKTALLIAKEINFPGNDIVSMTVVYDAEVNNLLEVVRGLPEASRDVMLVGHNPGLTDLANLFARTGINNIPTCGLLQLEFNAQHWRDILPGSAAVVLYDYPRRDMCSL